MHRSPVAASAENPHVLVLSKWWPNRADPQLGDFIRKQVQATAAFCRITVLLVERVEHAAEAQVQLLREDELDIIRSTFVADHSPIRPWRKMVNFLRYWRAAQAGWRMVMAERGVPQLVHVHILVRPALLAHWILRKHGIPYILSEQSSEYLNGRYRRKGMLFHGLNQRLFGKATVITAVSTWLGDGLVELGLCTHYDVVPNVVPGLDRALPPRGRAGDLLVVADLVDGTKNVSGVINALANARLQGADLRLTIIGDGPDRNLLETLSRECGVAEHVDFLGRLPNAAVLDHMAHCGTVIINSNVETFSVVTGEALAMGKPVVATRCGGPQGFITPSNGLLIPVGDHQALVAAMLAMVQVKDRYDPAQIRASVNERFSPAAVGKAFVAIYQRSLSSRA